ncbi:MAG: hypothetical protein L0Y71_22250 [Gemmataceae bacterium]|nr:hypothetical protein [Gemmataceae bacterium]
MATVAKRKKKLVLSREVKAFAKERGLAPYLPGILDVLHRVFADATKMSAEVHEDPEVENLRWIVFDVEVPCTLDRLNELTDDWYRSTPTVCPMTLHGEFGLGAHRVEPEFSRVPAARRRIDRAKFGGRVADRGEPSLLRCLPRRM